MSSSYESQGGGQGSIEAPSSSQAPRTASAMAVRALMRCGVDRAPCTRWCERSAPLLQESYGGKFIEGVANGLSLIALEEWTMSGAIESGIDLLRDRLDPNMADLDQAIPQWVFERAKARRPTLPSPAAFVCAPGGTTCALGRLRASPSSASP